MEPSKPLLREIGLMRLLNVRTTLKSDGALTASWGIQREIQDSSAQN
jgi:hypothetical protein